MRTVYGRFRPFQVSQIVLLSIFTSYYRNYPLNTYQEKTHEQNLKANALTQKLINSGKEADIETAESIHTLVSQVAFYRGVNLTTAKKIVSQILRGVPK